MRWPPRGIGLRTTRWFPTSSPASTTTTAPSPHRSPTGWSLSPWENSTPNWSPMSSAMSCATEGSIPPPILRRTRRRQQPQPGSWWLQPRRRQRWTQHRWTQQCQARPVPSRSHLTSLRQRGPSYSQLLQEV